VTLIRWDPFSALARLDTDFDDLVRRTWGADTQVSGFVPAVDIVRDGPDVVLTLELPGVDITSDVAIEVAPRRLTISGSRSTESERAEGRTVVREMRSGSFRREFALPEHVTADDIEAGYDKGLLTIRVHDVTRPEPTPTKIAVRTVEGDASGSPEQPAVES
jgi:HSP20 family protein